MYEASSIAGLNTSSYYWDPVSEHLYVMFMNSGTGSTYTKKWVNYYGIPLLTFRDLKLMVYLSLVLIFKPAAKCVFLLNWPYQQHTRLQDKRLTELICKHAKWLAEAQKLVN
jgi:hypothetical protein